MLARRTRTPQQLEHWLARSVAGRRTPGLAVLVSKDGETVYERGFGHADLDAGRLVDPATRFRWYSVTKPVTATTVLRLLDREGLGVDEPAQRFVPQIARLPEADRITIAHLLSHTSGLPNPPPFDWGGPPDAARRPVEQLLEDALAPHARLRFSPGRTVRYSNVGYLVLEALVKSISDEPFERHATREVLAPLGMQDTSFGGGITAPDVAIGHESLLDPRAWMLAAMDREAAHAMTAGRHRTRVRLRPFRLEGYAYGGLVGPVTDLGRFARSQLDPDAALLSEATLRAMHGEVARGRLVRSALGWFVGAHRGRRWIRHTGSAVGYRSELRLYPDEGLAVAALVNAGACYTGPIVNALSDAAW